MPNTKVFKINYALAATLLAAGQSFAEIAPQVGAKTGDVVKQGLLRKGITKKKALAPQTAHGEQLVSQSVTLKVANQALEILREKSAQTRVTLANLVEKQSKAIAKRQVPSSLEDQNTHADTTQKLVRSASAVFGWEDQGSQPMVVAGVLTSLLDGEQPVIDVESSGDQTPK